MIETLKKLITAHYPIIALQSFEWYRLKSIIHDTFKAAGFQITTWNNVEGLVTDNKKAEDTEDPVIALRDIFQTSTDPQECNKKELFLLADFHDYLEQKEIRTRLRILSQELKYSRKHIIILSPIFPIPVELEKEITLLEVPLPDKLELRKTLKVLIAEIGQGSQKQFQIDRELEEQLVNAALGLTIHEADLAFSRALVETNGFNYGSIKYVIKEKEQVIKKSKILEYYHTNESFKNIGGLNNLKSWLNTRGQAFSVKALDFGIQEPKGVLLTGVPGCGKSLIAKAIASIWNMPLLRLDIGKVFEGIVGSSENNMRKAILTAEGIAPCVLWLDEIEKGLAGIQSSGATDSGTTARVFSTFLTWMQEKTKPVFIVATANNLDALPPEILRKGRFDEIFFVDLPTQREREEIFKIHVEKLKRTLSSNDYQLLASATKGFNGAEIESVVKDALFLAFDRTVKLDSKSDLSREDIAKIIQKTIPLSATRKAEIENMREIAKTRFVLASTEPMEQLPVEKEIKLTILEQKNNRIRHFDIKDEENGI